MNTSKTDLSPLLKPWLSTLRMKSENTARSYEGAVAGFFAIVGEEIGPDSMATYLESLQGLSPATKAHHVSAVKSFLKFAQRQGVLGTSLLDYLVRPHVAITSFNRYLNLDEAQALARAAQELGPRQHAAIRLMLGTGLRVGEVTTATWKDLFLDPEGRLGLRIVGKRNKERVVRVREDVWKALVTLRGDDKLDPKDQTPLIPSRLGSAYTTRGLGKMMEKVVEKSGLEKSPSPHWLRHTHATLSALGGASVFSIQSSLGHSDISTSQRYIHWARGLAETTVDALPQF